MTVMRRSTGKIGLEETEVKHAKFQLMELTSGFQNSGLIAETSSSILTSSRRLAIDMRSLYVSRQAISCGLMDHFGVALGRM